MSNRKRTYTVIPGHEIEHGEGHDNEGYKIVRVYHNGKMRKRETKPEDKIKYISAGKKIKLTHDELIKKKYWRDVYVSNSVEYDDMVKTLKQAMVDGRKETLMRKVGQLGLPKGNEIVEKYLDGSVLKGS